MWGDWVDSRTPATHIIGHWNYAPGTRKEVDIASNGKSVELFLDGRSLGNGERYLRGQKCARMAVVKFAKAAKLAGGSAPAIARMSVRRTESCATTRRRAAHRNGSSH
jgi:hypothetical protein